jgi:peptidoglycan/LPS O-acetylase OafA/YrhL
VAATTGAGPQPLGHIPALDGIRAVAIGGVMGLHAIDRFFPSGALGVDVFFALSAFLITSLIVIERDSSGELDYRRFYWRRAVRLLPALVLWLVAVAPVTALARGETESILSSTVAALFYVANVSEHLGLTLGSAYYHAWSLSVEEQFYAIWPAALILCVLRLPRRWRRGFFIGAVVLAEAVYLVAGNAFNDNYFLPTGHLVPLACGALAADLWLRGMSGWLVRLLRTSALGILALVVVTGLFAMRADFDIAVPAVGVASSLVILHVVLNQRSVVSRILSSRPAEWIGQRSYGLYLYHRTLALLIPALWVDVRLLIAGPLVLALSLAVAEVSYRFVERPIRKSGKTWIDRRRATAH